jgi:hydrogenase expression/formation protein HypE
MIRAVLFDFDGTLTRPGSLDFAAIRAAVGCPAGTPVLEYIEGLSDEEARSRAAATLEAFEMAAARGSTPNRGAEEVLAALAARGIPFGILTRNSRASVRTALESFSSVREGDFRIIICREDAGRPKPHPDGVLLAARRFGCRAAECLVVGDYRFDVEAGGAAGAVTALLSNGTPVTEPSCPVDFRIEILSEVIGIIDRLNAGG